jgi:hypothetical protein
MRAMGWMALIVAAIFGVWSIAKAAIGTPPVYNGGPSLIDNNWLIGLSGGSNFGYVYGLVGAGTNQATATQLPCNSFLEEADTVAASTGFALCPAYQGGALQFYNNGANTVTIYPNVNNNPLTSAQDTINNGTSVTVASHTAEIFFAAKNGVWAAH